MNIQPRHTERRGAERIPFSSRVAIKTDKAIYFMETKNIARGGAYIESEIQVPIGTTCNLVPFMDECANIFEAEGTIVRSTKLGTRYGMGIRFDRIPEGDIDSLQEIVIAAQQNEKVTALA